MHLDNMELGGWWTDVKRGAKNVGKSALDVAGNVAVAATVVPTFGTSLLFKKDVRDAIGATARGDFSEAGTQLWGATKSLTTKGVLPLALGPVGYAIGGGLAVSQQFGSSSKPLALKPMTIPALEPLPTWQEAEPVAIAQPAQGGTGALLAAGAALAALAAFS